MTETTDLGSASGRSRAEPSTAPDHQRFRRSDEDIKRDVEAELEWDPEIDPTDIAVTVKDGVLTLTGFVRSYDQKLEAEAAAKRVIGVLGVANDLEVLLPRADERPDPEIARHAIAALRNHLPLASQHIRVSVQDGWIRLEGEVERNADRKRAEKAVSRLKGVRGISNLIQLKPKVKPSEAKNQIEEALRRNVDIDERSIRVDAYNGSVLLEGTVHSWAERQEVERIAWSVSGVTRVEARLVISP